LSNNKVKTTTQQMEDDPLKVDAASVREKLLADLAWECAERLRKGEDVDLESYLSQCPDDRARDEFRIVISMSVLTDAAVRRGFL
jgi:hypothetical protein